MSVRSHRLRSWSDSSTSDPSAATRAARRDSLSSSRASRPSASPLVGHQFDEHAGEADRLDAEVGAHEGVPARRRVALVEHEVDDGEHGAEPVGELGVVGDAVGDVGGADLLLRPHQALRHRRLRHEERAGDLVGLQPAEQAQREGDLRAGGEGRVAAREDQPQAVVLHRTDLGGRLVGRTQGGRLDVPIMARRLAAQPIDGPIARRRDDPRARVRRPAGLRPLRHGDGEGLLNRILGDVDVAEDADQRGDGAARTPRGTCTRCQRSLSSPARPGTGAPRRRRHMPPTPFFAQSRAASRSAASMTQKPPICSLVSA